MSSFPLYLMRHGEPELAGRMLGRTDCAVTANGVQACLEQARDLSVVRRITSDLRRARACAEPLGPAVIDPRWRELDFGDWDGRAAEEIDPAALASFWEDPDLNPPPHGERWSDLVARVSGAIASLAPEPTLVVTHGGPMRAALHVLCGFDLRQTWAFDLPYAAILGLRVWDGSPRQAQVTGLWP